MLKSFVIPSSEVPGYSPIYRHPDYKDGSHKNNYTDITTVYELFKTQDKVRPKEKFLGCRTYYPETESFGDYEWLTTTDVAEMVEDFGSGLDQLFATHAPEVVETTGQQPLGIFSINRPEWILAELAASRSRRYSVGISDVAGVESSEFYICTSELKIIVCSMDKIPRMLERIEHTPELKVVISMDRLDCTQPTPATQAFNVKTTELLKSKAASLGLLLTDINQVIEMGRVNPTEPVPPKPTDYYTLLFSSGTTGAQKGILVTHGSFVYSCRSSYLAVMPPDTNYLSYMSLAHVFDRFIIYSLMHGVVHIGFSCGNKALIMEDMQTLRPNVIGAIPIFLNLIYNRVTTATVDAKGVVGFLSRFGLKSKIKRISSGRGFKHAFWDKLIFDKVAKLFGGNIRLVFSAAMSLDPDVHNFFRAALSCNVIQGFGQSETMASGTIQRANDVSVGNVGIPMPGIDIRLRSIPDISYNATDSPCPRGEIMVRSKAIFSKYYNEPEKTVEAMDGEWLATGDIAQLNTDGSFTIIDRIKNIIRTADFDVEPESLEMSYSKHKLVDAVFVHGSMRAFELIAIVVPKPETFIPWAQELIGDSKAGLADLCNNKKVVAEMVAVLRSHELAENVSAPALIGAVHLEPLPFDKINCNFLTASLKLRRFLIVKHYDTIFEGLYRSLPSTTDANDSTSKNK
ncbi:medium-chain fatty acid-CoA ligase faa2 [Coemansia interrupta]|uniref:Medium-chain fatty acid-CoA ligase faa2 n=1 Tax=Coemansia interrupta TaxID=1126814 RepID=A0A9W8LMS6_9FUNG|nr:medium-chain fatty acid-CoA ligase faa2 [Coemansia interrupta]